jgi:hypothetical protein
MKSSNRVIMMISKLIKKKKKKNKTKKKKSKNQNTKKSKIKTKTKAKHKNTTNKKIEMIFFSLIMCSSLYLLPFKCHAWLCYLFIQLAGVRANILMGIIDL